MDLEPTHTLLAAILARFDDPSKCAIFDLDSTLLDNRPRQAAILRDYGASVGVASFANVEWRHFESWDLRAALRNAGVSTEEIDAHYEELRRFWRQSFFTSAYCRYDFAVPGAAPYVREIAQRGRVIYLTGRPPEMRDGTITSLSSLGFPLPVDGGTTLLLKPDSQLDDDAWKLQAVTLASGLGSIVAVFDNEPTHINGYRSAWPDAVCVRLATDHSGRPVSLAPGVLEIPNFVF